MHLVKTYLPLLQKPTSFEHTKILPPTFDKNPIIFLVHPFPTQTQHLIKTTYVIIFPYDETFWDSRAFISTQLKGF